MKKLLALMVALIMVLGLAGFALALETHHPAKKDRDGRIAKNGKSIGIAWVNAIAMEGSTSNANHTVLSATDPTAINRITLPDSSGAIALTGDISSTMTLSNGTMLVGSSAGLAVETAGTDAQMLVYNAGDGWGPDTMSGDGTISNAFVLTIGNDKIGNAELNFSTVNVPIGLTCSSGSVTVTAGSIVAGGAYPFANVDAEVANITSISSTTLTVTLIAAQANDVVIFRVPVYAP